MAFSRHLYSIDEVQSALSYYTGNSKIKESMFWCLELIDSNMIGEAISVLFESWLWSVGPYSVSWLLNAHRLLCIDDLSRDNILLSCYQLSNLAYSIRDNSLWYTLITTSPNEIPDRITSKTPDEWSDISNKIETFFIRSLFQKKTCCAWWISQYISSERVWELLNWYSNTVLKHRIYDKYFEALKNYEQLLGYSSNEWDKIILCNAIISCCITEKHIIRSISNANNDIPESILENIKEWDMQIGRKKRRVFTIPSGALYGTTLRGTLKWSQNNMNTINNMEHGILESPFWRDILDTYADISDNSNKIQWKSDTLMEEFYSVYFPDDIPDEWTICEKLKSHGDGVLGPTKKVLISKYSSKYMNKKIRLAWNTRKIGRKILDESSLRNIDNSEIIHLYSDQVCDINIELLKPVKKVKIL